MRAAIVVACVLCASTASAQGIGREWLEKMSGPDLGGIEIRIPLFCDWTERKPDKPDEKGNLIRQGSRVWYWQTSDATAQRERKDVKNARRFCIDAAYGSFSNGDREDEAFHVSGQRFEAAFTWRLDQYKEWLRFLEPGIAVGALGFLTDNHRRWRLDIAGRIAIRPLDLVPKLRAKRWGSVIQITLRPEGIFPGVTDEDLGANPAESFEHRFRLGGSWRRAPWIVFDFSEKLGLR